ncbi:hypothetical protein [Clostridium sp.]|uniref:hypothetical protein n=1 Tax=Clostridium sp. TaxID=1506 RepID=UPI0025C4702F|nr:hypothetical protein [Clostridium sp.]
MKTITIDSMLVIDDTGMPVSPTIRQLLDRDIRTLYTRDKSKDKKQYIAECIIIYQLGDPKSPARQSGLSEREALKYAIEQAGLNNDYIPDQLVLRLIKRYYDENITEAGRVVENILQTIHNINLGISQINRFLNEKLASPLDGDTIGVILTLVDNVKKQAGDIPSILKKLEEAKQNLLYEQQTELSRGGTAVLSSMDAEEN